MSLVLVVTEVVSMVSENVTEIEDDIETEVSESDGEVEETVGDVVSVVVSSGDKYIKSSTLDNEASTDVQLIPSDDDKIPLPISLVTINLPSPYVTDPRVELDPEVLSVHEDPSEDVRILPPEPTVTKILFP